MKKVFVSIVFLLAVWTLFSPANNSDAQDPPVDAASDLKVTKALMVIEEFLESPDKEAAASLMRKCAGVAIFPSVYKGAFIVGAEYGTGVMCAYDSKTGKWSAPAFFKVGGGSFGYQIGAQATDLLLIIANKRGLDSLLRNTVTLGGDVSVAAGPVGRSAKAETDITFQAGIYSYSRSKGAFAGVSLKGAVVSPDFESNRTYYGQPLNPEDILLYDKVRPIGSGSQLIQALKKFVE